MKASQIQQVSATGDVTTRDTYLRGVVLTAAAATSTVAVRAGGSGGAVVLTLSAVANTTAFVPVDDALCPDGVHATLAGASAVASFIYA